MALPPKENLIKMEMFNLLMISNVFIVGMEVQINESCTNNFTLHN